MAAMRVVVVGGGFGGMAVAARLAKLGHAVTLLERGPRLGGALAPVERDGFVWDGGPSYTLLPAVVRDLFRKSGRPVDRELELVELDVLREHRFADGSSVRLPFGSRAAQIQAVDALGPGLGTRWAEHVQAYADDWEVLRREYLERPWDPAHLPAPLADRLRSRETLAKRVRRLKDERLAQLALHAGGRRGTRPARRTRLGRRDGVRRATLRRVDRHGRDVRRSPTRWRTRLATRKVEVRTSVEVRDLVVRGGAGRRGHHRRGRHRRGRGRGRLRPAPAAGSGATRAADDARAAARRRAPRAGGRPAGPPPRDRPARLGHAAGDHRADRRELRGRCSAAAGWTRTW